MTTPGPRPHRAIAFWLVLVCWWAYFNLTAATLLHPVAMPLSPVVLYREMHYGRISGLTAMLTVTIMAPALLVALGLVARRWILRWLIR